jgi:hypothetical protein
MGFVNFLLDEIDSTAVASISAYYPENSHFIFEVLPLIWIELYIVWVSSHVARVGVGKHSRLIVNENMFNGRENEFLWKVAENLPGTSQGEMLLKSHYA